MTPPAVARPAPPASSAFATALRHWDLRNAYKARRLPGAAGSRCALDTPAGRFVLREVRADPSHLAYEVRVIDHLATAGFPYRLPRPLPTRDGAAFASEGDVHWLLYAWIDGRTAPRPRTTARAADVARLVAATERALTDLDLGDRAGRFRRPPDERAKTVATLASAARWLRDRHPRRRLARAIAAHGTAVARAVELPDDTVAALRRLPMSSAFADWRHGNLLARSGRLVALLDFDGLAEVPRVADVQNALTHVLASAPVFRTPRLVAFARALGAAFPLAPDEAALVPAAMRERLPVLIAALLDEVRARGRFGATARRTLALVGVARWLDANESRLVDALATHATGRPGAAVPRRAAPADGPGAEAS
ncbi:MAG: hypothetical protein IT294_02470 [Deltaproteobacteria bacterium]|nr:hypothetical protein [Deltaproteobacteria bacterium]